MTQIALDQFIQSNRDELIVRCRVKVAKRSPAPSEAEIAVGIPLFLDQLIAELRDGTANSQTDAITATALKHGHDLFLHGFSISEVVHDYGDICQSVTEMAIEHKLPIGTEDFRTLNRCLDDAIAGAVTEYAREQDVPRNGELQQMRQLVDSTLGAFEALKSGRVGVGGSTGRLIQRNLETVRAALDTRLNEAVAAPPVPGGPPSAGSK